MLMFLYFLLFVQHSNLSGASKDIATCGSKLSPQTERKCQVWYEFMKCKNTSTLLRVGHCMTRDTSGYTYAMECFYFQQGRHEIDVAEQDYIDLPHNVSELNDHMCRPMNRKGFLCKDCIDGFGPSLTSVGYQCCNCSVAGYGILLYLLQQFLPTTLLYMIILIFRINLTSAPVIGFTMYSQIRTMHILFQSLPLTSEILKSPLSKVLSVFYGIWNLDFFQYVLPPFCVSSRLQLSHIIILSYLSCVYPFLLILLTLICIKLHDNNFRFFVALWRPFHQICVKLRKGWDTRRDMVDVFASFFLLSFSKTLYFSLLILECSRRTTLTEEGNVICHFVMAHDPSIICNSSNVKYVITATFASLCILIFCILPALLLVLYPIKIFRSFLTKCRINGLVVVTFVEKYHSCYKDGLDGKRDFRSFAGLYFFLRFFEPFYFRISIHTSIHQSCSYLFLTFLIFSVLIALVRPYKKTYMNIFDTFLLLDLTLLAHLCTTDYYSIRPAHILPLTSLPAVLFGGLMLYKTLVVLKAKKSLTNFWRLCRKALCQCVVLKSRQTLVKVESQSADINGGQTKPLLQNLQTVIVDIKSSRCSSH